MSEIAHSSSVSDEPKASVFPLKTVGENSGLIQKTCIPHPSPLPMVEANDLASGLSGEGANPIPSPRKKPFSF
jgi:hypothetical protein